VVGGVLNDVDPKRQGYASGADYYYYRREGYYYTPDDEADPPSESEQPAAPAP